MKIIFTIIILITLNAIIVCSPGEFSLPLINDEAEENVGEDDDAEKDEDGTEPPSEEPGTESQMPPNIFSLNPSTGLTLGGTEVKIEGENFLNATEVLFGENQVTDVEIIDANNLVVITPPSEEGPTDVTVKISDDVEGVLEDGFIYREAQLLYATNGFVNTLSVFIVDPETGAIEEWADSPFDLGSAGAQVLAFDPVNNRLFISMGSSLNIIALSVNPLTAGVSQLSGSPIPLNASNEDNAEVRGLAFDSISQRIIASYNSDSDEGIFVYNSDFTPANGSPFDSGGNSPFNMDFDEVSGLLFIADQGGIFSAMKLDSETGSLSHIKGSPIQQGGSYNSPEYVPQYNIAFGFDTGNRSIDIFQVANDFNSINLLTASAYTFNDCSPFLGEFDVDDNILYVLCWTGMFQGRIITIKINPDSYNQISRWDPGVNIYCIIGGMVLDKVNNRLLVGSNEIEGVCPDPEDGPPPAPYEIAVFDVDEETGIITEIDGSPFEIRGFLPLSFKFVP